MEHLLPAQTLPAVPHFTFGIFNLAVPNLIEWFIGIVLFFALAWLRLPRFVG